MVDLRQSRQRTRLLWVAAFAAISAFLIVTFSFRSISDTDLNSYQTRAIALHGDVDLSRYANIDPEKSYSVPRDGKLYSVYGVGVSLTALPLYAVLARLGASDLALQAVAAIPMVAAATLIMFWLLLKLFDRAIAVGTTVLYAFGTTMWPLASMGFFQHGPAALYQAIGLVGFFGASPSSPLVAGFGFAAATFVRPTLAIPMVLAGLMYLIEDRRAALRFALGTVLPIAGILVQNRWIWGTWLTGGYSHAGVGFGGDIPTNLWGLLFGWWRGLFVYSPVLIVGVAGWLLTFKRVRSPFERRLFVLGLSSVALVLFYAKWSTWYGGLNQFGYRYLLDIVPFLAVLLAYGMVRSVYLRKLAVPLGVLSVMTMVFGAAPNDFGWDGTLFASRFVDSSIGQVWIYFLDAPIPAVLRFAGVIALMILLNAVARSRSNELLSTGAERATAQVTH